ncbi:MAG: ParB family transcriptional regulator, chromosome partitioning protein [Pseudonocardiales bacterium]|nr:ParB family transcriptional regulator, chromosome partitioning protein [Pseudonocardiales bacterium]
MAEPTRGMGRGLAALLTPSTTSGGAGDRDLRQLPVELISPNPRQPRQQFDEAGLLALAGSLGERGLLQPVLVRPAVGGSYELIAGERRWRAAQLAGLATIPALVRVEDDAQSLELALIENMAREDLNPIEEARACALLVEELGLTREEIGRRVGRSRVAVSNLLRLLDLPDEALDMLARGDLTEGHGRAILMAAGHDERRRLARAALAEGWNVRRTEAEARAASEADPAGPVRAARGAAHPDQVAAATRLGEAFGRALGADVKVTARGTGYKVAMTFESLDEALELATRLGAVEPV